MSSFLIAFIVLFVAWILGGFVFHVAGGLIHILLVVALIVLVVHFLRGRPEPRAGCASRARATAAVTTP